MQLTLQMPDNIARQLDLDGDQGERQALEIFAVEGYRRGKLSHSQVGELLGLNFYGIEDFLKQHGAYLALSLEEHDQDMQAASAMLLT